MVIVTTFVASEMVTCSRNRRRLTRSFAGTEVCAAVSVIQFSVGRSMESMTTTST